MKKLSLAIVFFFTVVSFAQVGINTTNPEAQLDIKSSNQALPSNKDGLLIPKIDTFPATNPTAAQQGMLVYLTTDVGINVAGFYYWNSPTTTWLPIKGIDGGTLDQAYDFGGAGLGKTITADAGAVLINGTDGLVSTGTSGSGAIAPSGAGTKMFWNPRKGAFRAGNVSAAQWDDTSVGNNSVAFGNNSVASGSNSLAGSGGLASGTNSFAFGASASATGQSSFAFGQGAAVTGGSQDAIAIGIGCISSGSRAISIGAGNNASDFSSVAIGSTNTSSGFQSVALGIANSATGSRSTAFGMQNTTPSFGETVMGIGATTYVPSINGDTQFRAANATDRLFVIGNAIDTNNNGTVDVAERSDAIIVLKNGLSRLPSTTNTMIDAADGKAVVTKEYLQTNTSGTLDQAYDFGGAGLGNTITADTGAVLIDGTDGFVSTGTINSGAIAPSGGGTRMVWNPRKGAFRAGRVTVTQWDDVNIGLYSTAFGINTNASGNQSFAFGNNSIASGAFSTAFGQITTASGLLSTVFGYVNIATASYSTAFGTETSANGNSSTAFGIKNTANGETSTAFGRENTASSYGETVLGIGATTYTPSTNGDTQFRTANATDRLFVIGNAIDLNNNTNIETAERSDALIILKNGLTRLPSTTNAMITAADGKVVVTKEYLNNNSWNITGNSGTNPTTNFIGTSDNQSLAFRTTNTERMTLSNGGNLGIGTNNPSQRLEVAVGNIEVTQGDIYLGAANGVFNAGGGLMNSLINYIGDAYVAPTQVNGDEDLYIADDLELGGQGYKPGGGFWVAPSDRRLKQNIQPYTDGLESLLRINPVTYKYNSIFKTLDTGETYVGIIAQEVQEIAPYMINEKPFGQLIEEDENGHDKIVNQGTSYLTFDGSALTYMLINSIKEMNVKHEELKTKNKELENKLNVLLIRLQKLENK